MKPTERQAALLERAGTHLAGGGLGLHQIQVAKSVQSRVIAVTSSDDKAALVRQAGADEVIVSPDLAFSREVWRLTAKQGVDAVLENVVTGTLGESLRSFLRQLRAGFNDRP